MTSRERGHSFGGLEQGGGGIGFTRMIVNSKPRKKQILVLYARAGMFVGVV